MNNTSGNQDREIDAAVSHGEEASTHVSNLVDIIEGMDAEIERLKDEVTKLESALGDAQDRIHELGVELEEK